MISAIIPCAGQGKRMQSDQNKIFLTLGGEPLICRTLRQLESCGQIDEIIVAAAQAEIEEMSNLLEQLSLTIPWQVVAGGTERQHSIQKALRKISAHSKWVLVHDGARPFIAPEKIRQVIADAKLYGAAVLGVPVKDTIKEVLKDQIVSTPDRSRLWAVHTPQVFRSDWLIEAYDSAEATGFVGTDDASLVEKIGKTVHLTLDYETNFKITTPEDLKAAEMKLKGVQAMQVGFGYDVHELVEERELILGGVAIPYSKGLKGHSDADVLLHAISDALLGAAALGDIGRHFPDSDPAYKGISSLILLKEVGRKLAEKGKKISNIDATIVAQKPKLASYITEMNQNIARTLEMSEAQVNVKATTTEGLGFAGRQEGIAAYSVVSIY